MHQTFGLLFVFLALIASLASSFYVPNEIIHSKNGNRGAIMNLLHKLFVQDYYLSAMDKRAPYVYGPRHEKREFSADDLTLRFGKRSGRAAFNPEDLALRFGRR